MNIRERLYKKMTDEYEEFINELKEKDKDIIIEKAYEITTKDEIVGLFDPSLEIYDDEKIKLLLKSESPLEELYLDWITSSYSISQEIEDSIDDYLTDVLKNQREKDLISR